MRRLLASRGSAARGRLRRAARRAATRSLRAPRRVARAVAAADVAVQVTVVDGDTNRARAAAPASGSGRRTARSDRHGVAHVPLAHRAPLITSAAKSGLRQARRPALVPDASEVDDPDLPLARAVDDVRRRSEPDASAAGDPGTAAVPRRLVTRPRHADRVSGSRLGRRRVHRERAGDRARARHARRHA